MTGLATPDMRILALTLLVLLWSPLVRGQAATQESAPGAPLQESTPASLAEPVEITVTGEHRDVGSKSLSAREIRELPGAFGDPFRAIEVLPGVTPLVSGIPYFYMRGAPPNTAAYYVDGVRVPLLFHLGLAQGVVHPGLIERVDLYPSAAPARFGNAVGGIVEGRTREPALALHGEAHARLIDAGALVEAPFGEGRGSALVAGRYGYPGPVVSAFSDLKLDYWDYQTRATWQTSLDDTLGVFAFGSHDYLATASPSGDPEARGELVEQFVSDFHRVDLRWDHRTAGGGLRLAGTLGYDSQGAEPTYVSNRSAALRLEFTEQLSESVLLRTGADGRFDHFRMRITQTGPGEPEVPTSADPPPTNLTAAVHGDIVWRPTRRVELVPGVRGELFSSRRDEEAPSTGRRKTIVPTVGPRVATRIDAGGGITYLASVGLAHQYPSLRVGNVPGSMLTVPGFPFGVERVQTAAQSSSGFEFALPLRTRLTTTGFFTRFSGLTDLSAECFQDERGIMMGPPMGPFAPPYVCPNNRPVSGHSYGLEVLLRSRPSERLQAWLSYTLSRSIRQARFITPEGGEVLATVPSEFDRTHVLNAASSYDLGRRWKVGGRFLFYTGAPYSALDGAWPVAPYNAFRTPAFHRVDVRVEKSWLLGATGSIALVVEGQNVTLSKETVTLGMDCDGEGTPQQVTTTCTLPTIGPLTIPSVGVEAVF